MPARVAGLVVEHPGEVEAHDLAAGLGDVVVGGDARGLADDEARTASATGRSLGAVSPSSVRHVLARRGRPAGSRRPVASSGRARRGCSCRARPTRRRRPAPTRACSSLARSKLGLGSRGPRRDAARSPLVALHQLRLELDEPVDDRDRGDDVDLVEAQLDPRVAAELELSLAAQLADRHELDERRIAGVLEHERSGVRRRPVDRRGDPVGRALRAPRGGCEPPGPSRPRQRLDRDDRLAAGLAEADREAGPRQGAVGGVDVAVLELRSSAPPPVPRTARARSATSSRSAAARSPTRYFSSTSTGSRAGLGHARGSSDPARRRAAAARRRRAPDARAPFLEHLERVDRARPALERLGPDPRRVGLELPRPAVVGEHHLDDLGEARLGLVILDRHDRLDPPVEVAIHQVGRPDVPLARRRRCSKPQMRECSRNSPTIERTRMRSETPGRPGWMEHAPRMMRSMSTPALDAR